MNNNNNQQQFQQNMEIGSGGLARYRSAPSFYFASLLNSSASGGDAGGFGEDDFDHLFYSRDSSPEAQKIFSGSFMANSGTVQESSSFRMNPQPPRTTGGESAVHRLQPSLQRQGSSDYSSSPSVPRMNCQTQNSDAGNETLQDSYSGLIRSISSNPAAAVAGQTKMEGGGSCGISSAAPGGSSTLIRHSSSPAGLVTNRNIKNEFGASMENSVTIPGYTTSSWEDSVILSDDFLKGIAENDQRNDSGNPSTAMLSHHLSLPRSSADLSAIEKLMQDSVPCKIRAKRGFATHPRSIAERVRRTKISDRMRKLQELVPNMEKQTSTSDMLDLAVDYIKDLQVQVKKLADDRAKCTCLGKQLS